MVVVAEALPRPGTTARPIRPRREAELSGSCVMPPRVSRRGGEIEVVEVRAKGGKLSRGTIGAHPDSHDRGEAQPR
eukprot:2268404-Rhodomonas_salina.1